MPERLSLPTPTTSITVHLLFVLQTLFSIWMLVDAIRRGAEHYWWVIVMVPFGEVAYFVAVVLPDLQRTHPGLRLFRERMPTLEELRRDFRQTPSHANRVRLAEGLLEEEAFEEAHALFTEVLRREPNDRAALHGFARWARRLLEQALDSYESSPRAIRRQDARDARRARRLLRSV